MSNPKIKSTASNLQIFSDKEIAISLERLIDSVVMEVTAHRSTLQPQQVKESNDGALGINSLPDEIIIQIFGYLKQNQLGQISRVCRRWNVLTTDPVLWKRVNVKFSPSHRFQTTVAKSFINRLPSCVTSIRLNFIEYEYWSGKLHFAELCVKLQEKCPHLEELILTDSEISASLLTIIDVCTQYLQDVKKLVFHRCIFLPYRATAELGGTSNIEVLDLTWCLFGAFSKSLFSRLPNLKQLHLFSTDACDSWFEDDTSFLYHLHVLNVGGTNITDSTFPAIQNYGQNLKELYLCWVDLQNQDITFNNFVCPHLQTICLSCTHVTCEGVVFLIQSCPALENVYVDEDVAESFAVHPFALANVCKSGIVKAIGPCHNH